MPVLAPDVSRGRGAISSEQHVRRVYPLNHVVWSRWLLSRVIRAGSHLRVDVPAADEGARHQERRAIGMPSTEGVGVRIPSTRYVSDFVYSLPRERLVRLRRGRAGVFHIRSLVHVNYRMIIAHEVIIQRRVVQLCYGGDGLEEY